MPSDDGPDADRDGICDARDIDAVVIPPGLHMQGGGLNCSVSRRSAPPGRTVWTLAVLLGLALRRRRAPQLHRPSSACRP
jgi:MYXO-CTERM domain-containing protein